MGDVNDAVTTVLEYAKRPLKDNRLVPIGFSTSHPSYDTTLIAGDALLDPNFNRTALNEEGSGSDIVYYHVPVSGVEGAFRAFARVYYQPMPPGWNASMFGLHSARIDTFRTMLDASDGTPTMVAADSIGLGPLGIATPTADRVLILPNPTEDGWVRIVGEDRTRCEVIAVFDARGRQVAVHSEVIARGARLRLPDTPGLYYLQVRIDGTTVLKRVLRR